MKQNFNSLLIIKIFYKAVFGIAIYAFFYPLLLSFSPTILVAAKWKTQMFVKSYNLQE